MPIVKYDSSWVGIDSGREGLWKEPIWKDVLRIISQHVGERVYDKTSPIYQELEHAYPHEAWRTSTTEGDFRPLFRDYPNSWTRTGVVSLANQRFQITDLGKKVLSGNISKSALLTNMFKQHSESSRPGQAPERPFAILAAAFLETPRSLSTQEIFWTIMKNYRPKHDSLPEVLKTTAKATQREPASTPYRRLRNMLTLMRTAETIESMRRGSTTFWSALNRQILADIKSAML